MQQSQALLERAGLNVVQEDSEGLHNTIKKVHKINQLFEFGFAESEFRFKQKVIHILNRVFWEEEVVAVGGQESNSSNYCVQLFLCFNQGVREVH